MEELRIKCPSCGIILDVRNSKDEAVKRIVCPNCKKHLAITFREEEQEPVSFGALYYGEAAYTLKEGLNTIGRKHPESKADIQIATGDANLLFEHAVIRTVRLDNGKSKTIIKKLVPEAVISVGGQPLQDDDELVLSKDDKILLGDTLLIVQ